MTEPTGNRDTTSAEAAFFGAIRDLHLKAGEPSSRAIATAIGRISHTTVHAAIRGNTVPSWPVVQKLVAQLGGDIETFRQLWSDTRPGATARRSVASPEISVFISYARIDDKSTYKRISALIDGIADAYQSLTGRTVGVFKDVETIKLGDDWRDRIRLGLSASSIFLAFISPAYLRSAYCREELSEFLAFLDANSSAKLVIPLIYTKLDRLLNEFADDELWEKTQELNWLDIADLRYTDIGSSGWVIAIDRIADRIDEVLSSFAPATSTAQQESPEVELSPSKFERMAAIERKLPDMSVNIVRYSELMERLMVEVTTATPSMERADSFSKKLAVSHQLAVKLNPIADEMETVADTLVEHINELAYVAKFVADAVKQNPDEAPEQLAEFLNIMKEFATTSLTALSALEGFTTSVGQAIGYSSHLDRPLKKIRGAGLRVADLRGTLVGWQEEIATIQQLYPHLASG